ncbi:unnamed protein product [Eruca vesicaria subsp. sativa]|uniref:Transmembrane protein n=1 Tax=Eruca vesicaria subsp. sativa TaxID=29727 RepID=A0ABC8IR21_ERUVS|nr:unnamed protein product [Eruca vesicaria subsp. sativa]
MMCEREGVGYRSIPRSLAIDDSLYVSEISSRVGTKKSKGVFEFLVFLLFLSDLDLVFDWFLWEFRISRMLVSPCPSSGSPALWVRLRVSWRRRERASFNGSISGLNVFVFFLCFLFPFRVANITGRFKLKFMYRSLIRFNLI